jgi:hypothetical protein
VHPASTTSLITHPAHAAGSVAGRAIGRTVGLAIGAARVGIRTTARLAGWTIDRAGGPAPRHPGELYPAFWVAD